MIDLDELIAEVERAAAEKAWDEGFDTGDAGAVLAENPYRAAEIREGQP